MGKNQSSLHLGNEFNGYGRMTYLKASQCGFNPPLSQENVQLSQDFSKYSLMMLGSIPVILDSANINPVLNSIIGSMASVNQAIMTKDAAGNYVVQFNVASKNFTDGAYPYYYQIMNNEVPKAMGISSQWVADGVPKGAKWKYYQNGKFLENSWVKNNGKSYYLGSDQFMVTGWKKVGGDRYYFKSKIESGKETAGYVAIHWNKIKGKWYYFHSNGKMMTSNWAQDEVKKHWYYCGKEGIMATSTIVNWKGKKYFVKDDGAMAVDETINDPETGLSYEADENGVLTQVLKNIYANSGTDADRLSIIEQEANAIYIYKYLTNEGWSMESIAGLCGNIEIESHFNPGVWQKHHRLSLGYGIVQSTASRFLDYAGLDEDSADQIALQDPKCLLDLELEFIIWECQPKQSIWLQGSAVSKYGAPYKMSFSDFIASTNSPSDLALVFHGHYERSSDDQSGRNKRASNAKAWYKYFSNL